MIQNNMADRFMASCIGAAVGESIGMPAEGFGAGQIKEKYGFIDGPRNRPESDEYMALEAGNIARQTEALIAVLRASRPLPDLQTFASYLKETFVKYPEKWPRHSTFPWPPFPDEGHYTFAFALPGSWQMVNGRLSTSEAADWVRSLEPVSIVWKHGTWIYMRLLHWLFEQMGEPLDKKQFVKQIMAFTEEAEDNFPGDHKMKRRMQLIEPLLDGDIREIAAACGSIDQSAQNVLAFVGAVFYKFGGRFDEAVTAAANQGGSSGAVGFYLGSLSPALGGEIVIPGNWKGMLKEKDRLEAVVRKYLDQ
jgi:ADP-ribosylglycohydrolase